MEVSHHVWADCHESKRKYSAICYWKGTLIRTAAAAAKGVMQINLADSWRFCLLVYLGSPVRPAASNPPCLEARNRLDRYFISLFPVLHLVISLLPVTHHYHTRVLLRYTAMYVYLGISGNPCSLIVLTASVHVGSVDE